MRAQAGFTLIELVMVIVILGILAATALPKFYDFSSQAEAATAEGIYGGFNSTAAINFANNQLNTGGTLITTGATLLSAMAASPSDCAAATENVECTINGNDYCYTITDETGTTAAIIAYSQASCP